MQTDQHLSLEIYSTLLYDLDTSQIVTLMKSIMLTEWIFQAIKAMQRPNVTNELKISISS